MRELPLENQESLEEEEIPQYMLPSPVAAAAPDVTPRSPIENRPVPVYNRMASLPLQNKNYLKEQDSMLQPDSMLQQQEQEEERPQTFGDGRAIKPTSPAVIAKHKEDKNLIQHTEDLLLDTVTNNEEIDVTTPSNYNNTETQKTSNSKITSST